jgi:hypothetical protein
MKFSSNLRIAALGLLLSASGAFAAPCAPGTWADYVALTDCTIGIFTLNNFTYTDTNTVLADTNIKVTPFGLGLQFDITGYSVSGVGASKSVTLGWAIGSGGVQLISAEHLSMTAERTGSGIDQVVDPLPISTYLDSGTTRLSDTKTFSPQVLTVSMSDQLKLDTGLANAGTAALTGFVVSFDVPEPAAWTLLPFGLMALAIRRRTGRVGKTGTSMIRTCQGKTHFPWPSTERFSEERNVGGRCPCTSELPYAILV